MTLGVLVLAVGCGSSGASKAAASASKAPPGSSSSSGPRGAGVTSRPGTTGSITQVNPSSIYLQNRQSGQVTVNYTTSTSFSQTVASLAAVLKAGDCVTATAAAPSGSSNAPARSTPVTALTATAVTITSTAGSCTRPGGFGGPNGVRPSGAPRPSGALPSGAARRGGFGRTTFGTVSAVGNASFVVDSTRSKTTTKVTVTTTSATTFRQVEAASTADLKVGLCATAIGSTDDTGAVTARSIALSMPGANGCTTGFGGRFGRSGGAE